MTGSVGAGRLRCLVVDDEPLARRILETYLGEHPLLAHAGSCSSAVQALAAVNQTAVDVLFLDIQMPGLTGLGLLRALDRPPRVVFTTAHPEYAVEGFDVAAVDYLLKPIGRERFLRAVARLIEPAPRPGVPPRPEPASQAVYVRVDQQLVRVALDDILFVEACENYVRFHTPGRTLLTRRTLAEVEESLPGDRFARVHRSYLVNLGRVERLEGNLLRVGGREVPVSRSLRPALVGRLPIA